MDVVKAAKVRRGDIYLVSLHPIRGGEIRNTRPCVVVSPDELNKHIRTHIVAPMTTGSHSHPFRVSCRFRSKSGHVVLDQIRTVDRERLVQKLGRLSPRARERSLAVLNEIFAP